MSDEEFESWALSALGPYYEQLTESSERHDVPTMLLAAVILAELADYNFVDQQQEADAARMVRARGSLGISQIHTDTAIENDLLLILSDAPAASRGDTPTRSSRREAGDALLIPNVAIDAAAAELSRLIQLATRAPHAPWQTQVFAQGDLGSIALGQVAASDLLTLGAEPNFSLRFGQMARWAAGAYNSPGIITSSDPSSRGQPFAHAAAAYEVGRRLAETNLFR